MSKFLNLAGAQYLVSKVKGLLTAKADKATTLNGYGITDAYTNTEVDNKVGAKADKATTLNGYGITDAYTNTEVDNKISTAISTQMSDVYTKEEVDGKVSSVYKYKGTKTTYGDLPTTGQLVGDTYNIEQADASNNINAGDNVAWDGTKWDKLAGIFDMSNIVTDDDIITNEEIDAMFV